MIVKLVEFKALCLKLKFKKITDSAIIRISLMGDSMKCSETCLYFSLTGKFGFDGLHLNASIRFIDFDPLTTLGGC